MLELHGAGLWLVIDSLSKMQDVICKSFVGSARNSVKHSNPRSAHDSDSALMHDPAQHSVKAELGAEVARSARSALGVQHRIQLG